MRPASFLAIVVALVLATGGALAQTAQLQDAAPGPSVAMQAFLAAQEEVAKASSPQEQAGALAKMIGAAERVVPPEVPAQDRTLVLADLHRTLGNLLGSGYFGEAGLQDAVREYKVATELFSELGRRLEWANVQARMATAYWSMPPGLEPRRETLTLEAYGRALTVFTEEAHPEAWAWIQSNLVQVYTDLRQGDRADNVEQALNHGEAALRVRSRATTPVDWAITQNLMAYAWLNRKEGRRTDNLSRSIDSAEAALEVLSREEHPEYWAAGHMNLSSAYFERARREDLGDLDQALTHGEQALTIYTRDAAPQDWVQLQLNRSYACRARHRDAGDRYAACAKEAASAALQLLSPDTASSLWVDAQLALANALALQKGPDPAAALARAAEANLLVLSNFTQETAPALWAEAQSNLGGLYLNGAGGSADLLSRAIQAFERSLQVWTKAAFPDEWGLTQYNIGLAHEKLAEAGHSEASAPAVAAFQRALSVFDLDSRPVEWALAKLGIGDVHMTGESASRTTDIETALQAFGEVLAGLNRETHPALWGATQARIGEAYIARVLGDRLSNIALARTALEAALQDITKEGDPVRWGQIHTSLSATYYYDRRDPANIEKALSATQQALTVITPDNEPRTWAKLNGNLAAIYLDLPGAEMVEHLPLAIKAAAEAAQAFDRERNPYEWVVAQRNLASAHHRSALVALDEKRAAHLLSALQAYEAALAATPREARARERLLTLAGLVQVLADRDDWGEVERTADDAIATADALIGEGLREEEVREFVGRASYAASLGAFAAARRNAAAAAWDRLEAVRARLLWAGLRTDESALSPEQRVELQRLRTALRELEVNDSPEGRNARQALRSDIARVGAAAARLTQIPPIPPEVVAVTMAVTRSGAATLVRVGGRHVVRLIEPGSVEVLLYALYGSLGPGAQAKWDWAGGEGAEKIASAVGASLWPALQEAGVAPESRVVWIPPPEFSHIPLPIARNLVTGEALIDSYEIVQAPSLAAWQVARARAEARASAAPKLAGIFNPTNNLPHAEAERILISSVAPRLPMEIVPAGIDGSSLLARFGRSEIWHFATHGQFDWADFRRSGLELGAAPDGSAQRLTTEDLLYQARPAAPRVVLLTVCESALGDIKEYPDELLGLPAAFLRAGAAGVVATTWEVNDLSTALLVAKFYDGYINGGLFPPAALRQAQRWLRSATADDLFAFVQDLQARAEPDVARGLENVAAAMLSFPPNERPYADVKYWGAFVYIGA
jgi:tetratricopeptide (TPR) repeat protein